MFDLRTSRYRVLPVKLIPVEPTLPVMPPDYADSVVGGDQIVIPVIPPGRVGDYPTPKPVTPPRSIDPFEPTLPVMPPDYGDSVVGEDQIVTLPKLIVPVESSGLYPGGFKTLEEFLSYWDNLYAARARGEMTIMMEAPALYWKYRKRVPGSVPVPIEPSPSTDLSDSESILPPDVFETITILPINEPKPMSGVSDVSSGENANKDTTSKVSYWWLIIVAIVAVILFFVIGR